MSEIREVEMKEAAGHTERRQPRHHEYKDDDHKNKDHYKHHYHKKSNEGQLNFRNRSFERDHPSKVAKRKIQVLEIHQEYRERVSTHLQSLPKFKTLDDIGWLAMPMYDNVVDQYISDNANLTSNPRLTDKTTRNRFIENMRSVYGRKSILFSVDVEAWELDTNIITEIGIAIYDPRDQQVAMIPTFQQIHIRIKENLYKLNGRFVPEHASNFNGGVSYIMTKYEAGSFVQSLVDYYFSKTKQDIGSFLVGHDLPGDIKWLTTLGVKFPSNLSRLDTVHLLALTLGKQGTSLGNALNMVKIPHAFLHNAGNDAYYTLLLAMTLCDPQCRIKFNLDVLRVKEGPILTKEEKLAKKELKRQQRMEAKEKEAKEKVKNGTEEEEEDKDNVSGTLANSIEEVNLSKDEIPTEASGNGDCTKNKIDVVNKPKKKSKKKHPSNIAESIEITTAIDASLKIFSNESSINLE
ncbi:uncharacterized protein SPAPADRAFT_158820 [Spathaspora passalidarum NRRL Y-27907]|uniref:Gfd2/YDR514C-like C-terminal domain-containing protein n=1 Tax=Spathaspora passalidarum (strain NRRL Y-27907 / 11-Y1) TaxID=619300 RepID=G3AVQ4_SPAPN|nr:uncharacterized protein SPAPADRAFT_158820 [Spathaspora passalidarum NRRL Y-27907]EGW30219.1 hypothetical protein SPAPADRAFT_158820 [Spathaspora passalidarum NRRL Y-27907]